MAPDADPYRILGLPRGAPLADVKKAYRRLAKVHHPDAAGESALPRFLAIQAAYDRIVGPGAPGSGPARPGARRPWDADPARADATYRAYSGRARRARTDGTRGASEAGATGTASGRSRTGGAGRGAATGAGARPDGEPSGPEAGAPRDGGPTDPTGRSPRRPKKATLGSTSYDGVEAEPFEPDWGGASWYGTTSGTYWTLNPKEYADPRKHGPEYQARARRAAAAASVGAAPPAGDAESALPADEAESAPLAGDAESAPPADDGGSSPPPTHTTASWWEATSAAVGTEAPDQSATGRPDGAGDAPTARGDEDAPRSARGRSSGPAAAAAPTPRPATSARPGRAAAVDPGTWSWLERPDPGLASRIARALIGWVPVALALGWAGGQLTGCQGAAAACDPGVSTIAWLSQVLALVGLLLLPRLATVTAIAALVALAAAIPATLIANAPSGDQVPPSATIPALIAAVAWLVGAALAVARALRPRPAPVS